MRIALIRQRCAASGGAERYVTELLAALTAAGHDVHLYARRWTDVPEGVTVRRVPVVAAPAFLRALSFAWMASRMSRRGGYDLIHSFDRTIRPDIYRAGDGCHRAWLDRRREIEGGAARALDRVNPLHISLLALERHLFGGGCRRVIANSRMVREEILRYYGAAGSTVQVIYSGVDLGRFHPERGAATRAALRGGLGVGPDDPVVLFAGSGFERKGLRFLLEAAGRMRSLRNLRIWVVGKGDSRRMRALAERLGIAHRVHLAGPVTDPERWMAGADLFVLPTIYDPFSNACLEAMASGLPVITTAANGLAEIIEEGRSGAVVSDPRDVQGLADRMGDFLDPARRDERRLAARTAAEAFPMTGHVKQVLAMYEEVLRGSPA